jgi:hypothetical protein
MTLLGLAVAATFAFGDHVYWWLVEGFQGPALQQAFGFTVERQLPPTGSPQHWRFAAVSVVEGGRFSRGGVRPNDGIACLYHGTKRGEPWSFAA